MNADEDGLDSLARSLSGVNPSAPSTTKFSRLETYLAATASLAAGSVAAATISKAGNFSVRVTQSTRAKSARLFVGVVTDPNAMEPTKATSTAHVELGATPAVLLISDSRDGRWTADWGVASQHAPDSLTSGLTAQLGTRWHRVTAPDSSTSGPQAPAPPVPGAAVVATHNLVLDPRIRRMLRTSVATRPAVMLVGPPGTGKSQLVSELMDDVARDPSVVGMTQAHEANVSTPDESWTVRELVGGETVDDQGRLRFTTGAVLDALTQDKWLVLDEANRADMDRIFGGLLTWLSGQEVTVGRTSSSPSAGPVQLGWSSSTSCVVDGLERLGDSDPGGDPVTFLAGSEWRLLGTYNALDAQRVFRLGLALGRRFAHVPVPAPDSSGFHAALQPYLDLLQESDRDGIAVKLTRLYLAHQQADSTALGPAIFLGMPAYIAHGVASGAGADEVLAEAYLTAAGAWLSRLEDDHLDRLAVVAGDSSILGDQWAWVRSQLSALR